MIERKATLCLILCSSVFPELFTGNTPLPRFFHPLVFMFLMVGYGLFVLVIREAAVRMHASTTRIVLMGIAYGIVNEGLFAKTLINRHSLPIQQFTGYAVAMGYNTAWAAAILVWHAFASVLFPIYFVHYCLPEAAKASWLKNWQLAALTTAITLFAVSNFVMRRIEGAAGTPAELGLAILAIIMLVLLALKLPGSSLPTRQSSRAQPAMLGLSVAIPTVLLVTLAAAKVSPALYFLSFLITLIAYNRLMWHKGWVYQPSFLYFAIGWYTQNAIGSILVIMHDPSLACVTAAADTVLLVTMYIAVNKSCARTNNHSTKEKMLTP